MAVHLFWVLVFTAGPLVSSSDAQLSALERATLRGVTGVTIQVNGAAQDDACKLRSDDLALAAARPVVDAGLSVNKGGVTEVFIYVNVITSVATIGDRVVGCVGALFINATSTATGRLIHQPVGSSTVATALLWSDSTLFRGPTLDFGSRVNAEVRESVDRFATKVKLANAK